VYLYDASELVLLQDVEEVLALEHSVFCKVRAVHCVADSVLAELRSDKD